MYLDTLSSAFYTSFFFFNDPPPTEIYTLSLHDALPIFGSIGENCYSKVTNPQFRRFVTRSEEHTSELQSRSDLVCRLLLEKKKTNNVRGLRHRSTEEVFANIYQRSPTRNS